MTTMELIERGIGHNCLSDAYELGRADALDECIVKLEELYEQTKYPQYNHYCNGIEDCIDILDELKEKK